MSSAPEFKPLPLTRDQRRAALAKGDGEVFAQEVAETASADAGEGINLGYPTDEPTIRQMVENYYRSNGIERWQEVAAQYLAALRQTSSEPVGPQVCNVCEGFVPTWGVKVCQCEYMAPAGMKPAPEHAAVERVRVLEEALRPFASDDLFRTVEKRSIDSGSRFGDASRVSYPTTIGNLRRARAALNPQSQEKGE